MGVSVGVVSAPVGAEGEPAEGLVGPIVAALDSAVLEHGLGFGDVGEVLSVEALVPQASVEGLHIGGLPGRAGLDVRGVGATDGAPVPQRRGPRARGRCPSADAPGAPRPATRRSTVPTTPSASTLWAGPHVVGAAGAQSRGGAVGELAELCPAAEGAAAILRRARSAVSALGLIGDMLLIYDGECGFCTRWARWAKVRLPSHVRVEPWQVLELEALGLTRQEVEAAVCWLEDEPVRGPMRCQGAEAIMSSVLGQPCLRAYNNRNSETDFFTGSSHIRGICAIVAVSIWSDYAGDNAGMGTPRCGWAWVAHAGALPTYVSWSGYFEVDADDYACSAHAGWDNDITMHVVYRGHGAAIMG